MNPDELPPPDLLDSSGRLRRLAIALVAGAIAGAIAFFICDSLAKPDEMVGGFDGGSQRRAYGFVYYTTGLVFAGVLAVALVIQNHLAKKAYVRELGLPKAKIKK